MSTWAIALLGGFVPAGWRLGVPAATTLADSPRCRRTVREVAVNSDYTGRRRDPQPPPRRHDVGGREIRVSQVPPRLSASNARPTLWSAHGPEPRRFRRRGACIGGQDGPPRGLGAGEADFGGDFGEGGDDEGDVGVEVDAKLGGTAIDIVAVDRACEGLVLQFLPDR